MNRNLERATIYVFYCILDSEDFSFGSFRDVSVKNIEVKTFGTLEIECRIRRFENFQIRKFER